MAGETYVVDTSVAARWFLNQSGHEKARSFRHAFRDGEISLITTDCARFELPHVLRTHGLLPGVLDRDEYAAACRVFDDYGIAHRHLDVDEVEQCAVLAADHNLRFFDAVFVFECLVAGAILLTADGKLVNAVDGLVATELVT